MLRGSLRKLIEIASGENWDESKVERSVFAIVTPHVASSNSKPFSSDLEFMEKLEQTLADESGRRLYGDKVASLVREAETQFSAFTAEVERQAPDQGAATNSQRFRDLCRHLRVASVVCLGLGAVCLRMADIFRCGCTEDSPEPDGLFGA